MEINATLVFQAIHFFIAYGMVRFLLLKPVMVFIDKKRACELSLQNVVSELEKSVLHAHARQKKIWFDCRQFFLKKRPNSTDDRLYVFKNITPDAQSIECAQEEKEQASDTVAELLRERLGRVE